MTIKPRAILEFENDGEIGDYVVRPSDPENSSGLDYGEYGEVTVSHTTSDTLVGYRHTTNPEILDDVEISETFTNSCDVVATPEPTVEPTAEPTVAPTQEPTVEPTAEPTVAPTEEPTVAPTEEPTVAPTEEPTVEPTAEPTAAPTEEPTEDDGDDNEGPEVIGGGENSDFSEFGSVGRVVRSLRWGGLEYGFVITNYSNPYEDAIELSPAFLANLPTEPEQNTEFASSDDGLTRFYVLTTGEYQVNFGPDFEGKVHVVIFDRSFNVVKTYTFK